jgi:glutamyl-tRNA synthetase
MTVRRADGSWIFHFVNVIDDIEMKISHVIRGEDHLSNTPKHIELYRALGATPPYFAHIPLILNRDGSKMSKRDEGARVAAYIEQGYAPEAVRNYLCLLGWSPKDNREKIDVEEVVKLFELEKINRRNAAFDRDKCFWLQRQYIIQMSLDRFIELAQPFLDENARRFQIADEKYFRAVMAIVKEKITLFGEVTESIRSIEDSRSSGGSGYSGYSAPVAAGYSGISGYSGYFFTEDYKFDGAAVKTVFGKPEAIERLIALRDELTKIENWNVEAIESSLKALAKKLGCKTGDLVHPTRVAVSGGTVGPSLYHMLEVMGKDRVLTRIEYAREEIPKIVRQPS